VRAAADAADADVTLRIGMHLRTVDIRVGLLKKVSKN